MKKLPVKEIVKLAYLINAVFEVKIFTSQENQ